VPGVPNRISPWFLLLVAVTLVGGALAALGTPTGSGSGSSALLTAGVLLLVLGGWSVSLCLHEFGHAYVAHRSGDWTVREKGYLTLDIRRYTDPVLSFVLPVLFLLMGGIPLPGGAVWINHGLIRSRGRRSLVSLAGPLSNLVLGVLLCLAVAAVPMPGGLAIALSCLALVQVFAFVLNILPVPGLDGFGALEPFLPAGAVRVAGQVRPWAPLALFALFIAVPGVARAFLLVSGLVFTALGGSYPDALRGYAELQFWR
jgi:Zn-dependent protease